MNTLADCLAADLRKDEGLRLTIYSDTRGNPTIGYGRELWSHGISEAEARMLLINDCERVLAFCYNNLFWYPTLNIVRQRAIANMVYQLGEGGFGDFVMFKSAMGRKNYDEAYKHGKSSLWYTQTPARAERVLSMILRGIDA